MSIPLPQFHGKKGEKPEEHCLKVEDYFKDLKITTDANKVAKFKATLCGKARQWLAELRPEAAEYSHPDTDPIADRQATLNISLSRGGQQKVECQELYTLSGKI